MIPRDYQRRRSMPPGKDQHGNTMLVLPTGAEDRHRRLHIGEATPATPASGLQHTDS
jgi:hypothetical protein